MYPTLLVLHSIVRWILLVMMLYAIIRAARGYFYKHTFSGTDNVLRHWTATVAHIQLMLGIVLYSQSTEVKYFWNSGPTNANLSGASFFPLIHLIMMITGIVVLTIGSALAKRRLGDHRKFQTMFFWFVAALLIILLAIPWPFSPLSQRPLFRSF